MTTTDSISQKKKTSGLASGLEPHRLAALIDGIFAIAMTILVLNIVVPPLKNGPPTEGEFLNLLYSLRHHLINYGASFILLGVFWLVHHQQMHFIKRTDSWHMWANLIGLVLVCLVPFSSSLMGEYHHLISAAVVFEINMFLIGIAFYFQWSYATNGHRLVDGDLDRSVIVKGRRLNLVLVAVCAIAPFLALYDPRYSLLTFILIPATIGFFRKKLFLVY